MVVLTLVFLMVISALRNGSDPVALFAWPGISAPGSVATAIILLAFAATFMLALGLAGRLAALGLLVAVTANILATGLHLFNSLLLASAIALLLLGSGALSCWRPEDAILSRRAGESEGNSSL
jgi:hypothetical protein